MQPRGSPEPGSVPLRHVYFYVPNGIHMPLWTPSTGGRDYELPPILEPLSAFKDQFLLVSGLANRPGTPDGPGDHAAGTGSFLTATKVKKTESDIENGVSIDQVIAESISEAGASTRFPSIQLGSEGGASVGGCDSGYSCAYSRNISWAGPATPLPKMDNPQVVFDRFFAGFDPTATAEEIAKRRKDRLSVLDYALEDAKALDNKLSSRDREKLDEYMTSVRALERQVEEAANARQCTPPSYPPVELDFPDHVTLMLELTALALQCDLTRVASYMLANAASSVTYNFLGVTGGHHDISHHQDKQENFDKLTTIDTWEMERLAWFLDRLQSVEEPDGSTLLDNTMVFFSSEISDGNQHLHHDLPVLVAGGAQGQIDVGKHIMLDEEQPIADLYIALAKTMGVELDTFGDDGTKPLDGVLL